ncbi:MAG: hypothetical protein JW757_13570 [Anaerolineales bacterium]|nr:hypothetical protein [Anaerolineales bacterium]
MEIHDLWIQNIYWKQKNLTIVKESDPFLRRFGQCDFIQLQKGEKLEFQRKKADEVWCVVTGQAVFRLTDLRQDSSSYQAESILTLDGQSPKTVLVPFGVAVRIECEMPAIFIRLTTHEDGENPEDQTP